MFYILLTIWYGCLLLCVRYWTSLLISYSNYTLETASHFFVGFLVRYFSLLGFFDFHEFFFSSIDWSIWDFNFKKILHSKTYYRSFCADFNYFFCCFSRYLWLFLGIRVRCETIRMICCGNKVEGSKEFYWRCVSEHIWYERNISLQSLHVLTAYRITRVIQKKKQ